MTLSTASTMVAAMYQGTDYLLQVQVLNEDGSYFDLTESLCYLRLAGSVTDAASLLELSGTTVNAAEGKVEFPFVPANTSSIQCKAYDMSIRVHTSTGLQYVALQAKFGIEATNKAVV